MIVVDSGYFIALAHIRDQHFQRAMAWTQHIGDEQLLVSEFVLVETINALSGGMLRQRASDISEAVHREPQFKFVHSSPALLSAGLQRHRSRPDKEWSLTDCISFLLMDDLNIQRALSYDLHFEQAGFEALLRRDP